MEIKKVIEKLGGKASIITMLFIFLFWLIAYLNGCFSSIKEKDALYSKGIILRISKGAKGSKYLNVRYSYNSKVYEESYPIDFCDNCKNTCCDIGDSILIRFDKNNPSKSEPVTSLPK